MGAGRILSVIALATGFGAPAQAHTQWANGEPVPEWVTQACCGSDDVHHLRPEEVHVVEGGYRIDGVKAMVPFSHTLPSPDGTYWIFYRDYPGGGQSSIFCFFAPPQAY